MQTVVGSPIVVEVERSGFVESVHLVDVAVVDDQGRLLAAAGDPARPAAFRSCAKPIQARVCRESGWSPPDPQSLAISCASHYGQPEHVDCVRKTLSAAGLSEASLRCPPDVPLGADAALTVTKRSSVYHNCSGKHAAMLATSAANGWSVDGYVDPSHPLQLRIRARIEELTGGLDNVLVDGCGAPTFTASLGAIARAFRSIDDGGPEAAAMRKHSFLVAGSAQLDTDVMQVAPHVLIKSGAEGLVCIAAPGFGIALKLRDGNWPRARGPASLLVLRLLRVLDNDQLAQLDAHAHVEVLGGGERVGRVVARGSLDKAW